MSLNKFMHTRNPFFNKTPDYAELAKLYPEFGRVCKQISVNKYTVDYNDPVALKSLYCILMRHFLGLNVDVPLNHLIPRVPQRINYILWIEDLLNRPVNATGIDIGCGASCVFGLIACSLNKSWKMFVSDISQENVDSARENVVKNRLEKNIFSNHYKLREEKVSGTDLAY